MVSLNMFISFQERLFVNCRCKFLEHMKFSRIKMRIKTTQKVLTVFQYPHLIEAITSIDVVAIWLWSSFNHRQNVSHIYRQFICWTSRGTGFLWNLIIKYRVDKSSYSSLNRIFIDDMNNLWLDNSFICHN